VSRKRHWTARGGDLNLARFQAWGHRGDKASPPASLRNLGLGDEKMQRPIITFRLDEPYNYPGDVEARRSEDEEFEPPGVATGTCLENAASTLRPAEPARDGTSAPPQSPPGPIKTTNWITAISMVVLSLAAVYYAARSNGFNRSLYQLAARSTQAARAVVQETTWADQQAWLGIALPTAYPLTKEGGGFAIKLQNSGKTPALNVRITDYVVIEDLDQLNGMQESSSNRPMAAGTLMPGSEFSTDIGFRTSPEGVTSLAQGKVRAVNYALVTYEDIYHRRHTTQSCFYWYGGLHTPLPCEGFNTLE
jgi:hypothetical protein